MIKINIFKPFLFVLFFLSFFDPAAISGFGPGERKTPHRIPAANAKVKIDGILDEEVWQNALVLELDYEVEPGENILPPVKTEVLMAYTTDRLYAAFRAYDPNPEEIRAHVTDRDNILNDDYVGVILDTFNDSRRTYNFYCNPYGIQADRIDSVIGSGDQWDAIWNSAGRINEEGYIVEMGIPFSSLRFPRQRSDQVWGIDVVRNYPRSLSHIIGLFPRDRNNNCYMCQADKVIGFKGVRPGKNIELDPTLSRIITQERESFPDGKFARKTGKVDPGITARWRFTPNLTLSTAVNPDFSHLEADVAQLEINTQFALYYPEKRPFFLEDSSIFDSAFFIVHTRTLFDPDWGIKVTGKEGANAIGFFSVQDNITNLLFPWSQGSSSTSLDMNNTSSVLRYRRDVGKSSNLGFMITDREGEDYFNRLAGIDGLLKITSKNLILFQCVGSWTHYPDQVAVDNDQPRGNLAGSALGIYYGHDAEKYGWFLSYQRITPYFRADLGYMAQTDLKYIYGGGRYTFRRDPGHWYTRLNFTASYQYEEDFNNILIDKAFAFQLNYEGPAQSLLNLALNIGSRAYMGNLFDENYILLEAGIRPSGNLLLKMNGMVGDQIDFVNVRPGKRLRLNPIAQYHMGQRLSMSVDHVYERLSVEAGRLYTAHLSNFRLVYQFNRRTFLRTILQYANFNYASELYTLPIEPVFRHLFSQVLFSYKINPQTVLYLGYADNHYGYREIPLSQSNRTLFLKIGYALIL